MRQGIRQFRADIARFCEENLPDEIRAKVRKNQFLEKADYVRWQKILRAQGWFGGHWPREHGGLGWTKLQQWVFEDEIARQGAPWLIPFGVTYVGPVIINFGSEAQKTRYLGDILNSDVWWAQGYSEPGAGSDLASLKTRARRDGNHYILSGQKTWTTMAHWADMAFVLARTGSDGSPQSGISFLLVDLKAPGISIRPIQTFDRCHEVNEVFFDDVVVPAENLVGAEGRGWTYAKFLLSQERLLVAEVGKARRLIEELLDHARRLRATGRFECYAGWRRRFIDIETDVTALEALCLDLLGRAEMGQDPGSEASLLKIVGSELMQRLSAARIDLIGREGLPYDAAALMPSDHHSAAWDGAGGIREYLHARAFSIYGGSNEIQRNILAKAVLGL